MLLKASKSRGSLLHGTFAAKADYYNARCLCFKNALFTGVQCLYTIMPTFITTSTSQKIFYKMQRDWLTQRALLGSVMTTRTTAVA